MWYELDPQRASDSAIRNFAKANYSFAKASRINIFFGDIFFGATAQRGFKKGNPEQLLRCHSKFSLKISVSTLLFPSSRAISS
jgi:hypothetical protein